MAYLLVEADWLPGSADGSNVIAEDPVSPTVVL